MKEECVLAQFTPAGFWRRVAARLIDILVIFLFGCIFIFMFNIVGTLAISFVSFILGMAYSIFFLTSPRQATSGKYIMRVFVVRKTDGGRLSILQAVSRFVIYNASGLLIIIAGLWLGSPHAVLRLTSDQDKQIISEINEKLRDKLPLSQQEKNDAIRIEFPKTLDGLSESNQLRYQAIRTKVLHHEPITAEEKKFYTYSYIHQLFSGRRGLYIGLIAFVILQILAIAGTVAWTRNKTGLHDIICGTRVVRGRTNNPALAPDNA